VEVEAEVQVMEIPHLVQVVQEILLQYLHHKEITGELLMGVLMLIQVLVAVDQLQLEEHLQVLVHQEVQVEQEHQIQ
tara:strand:+ start:245 stop:475 length:231 start_codon:yes stop_codon:yes gene_type:complete